MFELVVDTNVVIAAMLKPGISRKLLLKNNVKWYAPILLKIELTKYKEEIIDKSGLSLHDFLVLRDLLFSSINLVPLRFYNYWEMGAKEICPDIEDWPFFALAMSKNCGLWSYEKKLKDQSKVAVFNTVEIAGLLKGF